MYSETDYGETDYGETWPNTKTVAISLKSALVILVVLAVGCSSLTSSEEAFDWRSDWAVQTGFDVAIDVQGLHLPTAIAFVPNPGTSPKDPLYFVTELKGRVIVITNDRSVFTFVEDFFIPPPDVGMAGICLDPKHGYVFVTFSYLDSEGIQRNNIVRFQTTAEIFSVSPISRTEFTEVFAPYPTNADHQIGPCQVSDSLLYVATGDGNQEKLSQRLDSELGKVLRMTLDGEPVPDNPFYQDGDAAKAVNFVWASGFRNPFGLEVVGDQVFVADNGHRIDRFVRIHEGSNFLWDGTDLSIGTNADAVISPGHGVAQLEHYPDDSNVFPDRFQNSFYLAITGQPGAEFPGVPAILGIPYAVAQSRLLSRPRTVLHHRGGSSQLVTGLAFGPDGLYFAPMMPNEDGMSAVLKLRYRPSAEYPFYIEEETNPILLMQMNGCFACHSLNNNVPKGVAPILDRETLLPRIRQRLDSEEYANATQALDLEDRDPFATYREARQAVQSAQGLEQIRIWIENRIQEPRFDDPNATMPNLGLSAEAAQSIARYLTGTEQEMTESGNTPGFINRISDEIQNRLPTPTRENANRYLLAMFAVGTSAGAIVTALGYWAFVFLRRKLRAR